MSHSEVITALQQFDPYDAMEIRKYLKPEYIPGSFIVDKREVEVEIPFDILLRFLSGERLQGRQDTTPNGTSVCIYKVFERKSLRLRASAENISVSIGIERNLMWYYAVTDQSFMRIKEKIYDCDFSNPKMGAITVLFPDEHQQTWEGEQKNRLLVKYYGDVESCNLPKDVTKEVILENSNLYRLFKAISGYVV